MGRILLGCLGAVVLTLVLLGVGGYFLVWRPVQALIQNYTSILAPTQGQPQQTPANQTPGASAPLNERQVQQFVRVRRATQKTFGSAFEPLQQLSRNIQNGQSPSLTGLIGDLNQVGARLGEARSAQQQALIREKLSRPDFDNVRHEVNRGLGVPEIDFQALASSLRTFQVPNLKQVAPPPNEANRRVLAPYLNELRQSAGLGLLGL